MDNLTVVRVLVEAERGLDGRARLHQRRTSCSRHLPEKLLTRFQYFICGPSPLDGRDGDGAAQDQASRHDRVHTERFDMV